jgi:hypothetical protein
MDYEFGYWIKSTAAREGELEQNSAAAFGTILRCVRVFKEEASRYFIFIFLLNKVT